MQRPIIQRFRLEQAACRMLHLRNQTLELFRNLGEEEIGFRRFVGRRRSHYLKVGARH